MKLYWSPTSPFARKVMVVAYEKQLGSRIDLVRTRANWALEPDPLLLMDNPLAKIPTLVFDTGASLFDSRVICEYLDSIGDGDTLLPDTFSDRVACLRWQAFGDGVTDALLLMETELQRGDSRNSVIVDGLGTKVRAALLRLDKEAPRLAETPLGLGHVSIACMLGHLDLSSPDCGWRAAHPPLAAWYSAVEARPSMQMTAMRDGGVPANGLPPL